MVCLLLLHILVGFVLTSSGRRVKRRCRDDFSNFTGCEAIFLNAEGILEAIYDIKDGGSAINPIWNNNYYNGFVLHNISTVLISMNTSQPYYYLTMEMIWNDFYENFTVDLNETFFQYRNVQNNNNNDEWLNVNATLDYYDAGLGIVAKYGFNDSSKDNRNGVLTDSIKIKIKFVNHISGCVNSQSGMRNCRLTNIQLWSHNIPTLSPTGVPTFNPSIIPTIIPSYYPSTMPTVPTINPSVTPTGAPTHTSTNGTGIFGEFKNITSSNSNSSSDSISISLDSDESGSIRYIQYGISMHIAFSVINVVSSILINYV